MHDISSSRFVPILEDPSRPHNVYCITNLVNGKIYVGYTSDTLHARWVYGHLCKARANTNQMIYNAIRKYGRENFKIELVSNWTTVVDALAEEVRLIAEWQTQDAEVGYNMSPGGDAFFLGRHHTDDAKKRISVSQTGIPKGPCKQETKDKISKTLTGRKLSPEHIENAAATHRGKKHHPNTGKNISEAKLKSGYMHSIQSREKISLAKKGKPSYIRTPETLKKQSEIQKNAQRKRRERERLNSINDQKN